MADDQLPWKVEPLPELPEEDALVPRREASLPLHTRIDSLRSELKESKDLRRDIVLALVKEQDPAARSLLRQQLNSLNRSERFRARMLTKLEAVAPDLLRHFERLCNGSHPQQEAILRVVELEKVPPPAVFNDRQAFARILWLLVFKYPHIERELEIRDQRFRAEYTEFRKKAHEYQVEIEELAAQRGMSLSSQNGEDAYRSFVSLAKDKANLGHVQRGLRAESPKTRLTEAERLAKQAREEADRQTKRADEASALAETKALEEGIAREKLEQERRTRERLERASRDHETKLKTASENVQALEKELQSERTGERKRQEYLARFRVETSETVRAIRAQEVARISEGGSGMQLDPHFGYLMIEARRVFNSEIEEGEWETQDDPLFFRVVQRLLALDNPDERFFHEAGREVVESLNQYFSGQTPLADVVSLVRSTLRPDIMAPKQVPRKASAWASDLVEAWIVPHRDFQRAMFRLFSNDLHPGKIEIHRKCARKNVPRPDTEEAWFSVWDLSPEIFAIVLDEDLETEQH